MTVSLDARTPSASVHALSGSTPPGAAQLLQPFSFNPEAASAAGLLHLYPVSPDAEVIDLAGRVKALVVRERAMWKRRANVEDQVDDASPPRPISPADVQPLSYRVATVDGERTTTIVEPAGWAETLRSANAAHAVAQAEHERLVAEIGARLGLPRWEKLSNRASVRLARWGARLATLAPQTQTGLKAKVEASMICTKGEVVSLSDWRKHLATSISADALRIISAEADARAEQDRQADGELLALGRAWAGSCARYERACADEEALLDIRDLIAPPRVLLARPGDVEALAVCPAADGPSNPFGKPWYGDVQAIGRLRHIAQGGTANARRDEILAAYDRWSADVAAENERSGLVAAQAERKAAADENAGLRARICMMPSHTKRGVDLKHRVVLWLHDGPAGLAHEMEPENVEEPQFSSALALSALLDITRMASATPAAIPAPATASNIRPVPMPADISALRLGADAAGDVREWYRSWLYAELRLLNLELDGSTDKLAIRQDNPGAAFHYPAEASWTDVPKPSTRAAAVLGLLGILPRHDGAGDLARVA